MIGSFSKSGHLVRLLLVAGLSAAPVAAQQVPVGHVLVVTGLSGEPSFAATFLGIGDALVEAASSSWGVPDSQIIWLAERAPVEGHRIDGRATRGGIDSAITRIAASSARGDGVAIFLIGHGSGAGADSRLSVPGADPTAAEYATLLDKLAGRTVVVVIGASGAGDFVPVLARPGRVVVTATRSSTERNESLFAARFSHGLVSGEADADKDGRITVLEAFDWADREVDRAYSSTNRLRTEHALLDDDGDGSGSARPGAPGTTDGALARRMVFGIQPVSTDPRVARLISERQQLEVRMEELRRRKDDLPEADYLRDLESLLVQIAERSQAIRAAKAGGP